jgi:adenosylcobinamide-GDP ribazoletransferase
MKGLLLAVQFLTIIPVSVKGEVTQRDVARSAAFFPLVGALQGVIGAFAALIAVRLFPPTIAGGLVLFVLTAVNGGFHLDALADTFDALAVKSTGNREEDRQKRLSVMKDSATGAIGVTAIVMALLLKYLFISPLYAKYGAWGAAYLLFLMPLFSKWAIMPALFHGRPAASGGLGRIFIEGTDGRTYLLSWLLLAAAALAGTWLCPSLSMTAGINFLFLPCICLYAFSLLWAFFCNKQFGGLTGDTIGAAVEIADLLFLAIAFLWF